MMNLTALEISTLQTLKENRWNQLVRNQDGRLYGFDIPPEKQSNYWHNDGSNVIEIDYNLFQFIKWKDSEPTSIDALLESSLIKSENVKEQRQFDTGFVRDNSVGKGRMDLLPWGAIMELSKHCQNGAEHYGERNIDKGAPISVLMDSALRHLAKYMQGETDEDHLLAAMWNVSWAVEFETNKKEMQDIPNRLTTKSNDVNI